MKHLKLNRLMILGAAVPVVLATHPSFALTPQKLAEIRDDRNANVSELIAEVDRENQLQGIDFDTQHKGDDQDGQETHFSFTLQQLDSPQGVVLDTEQGRNAILMQGHLDATTDQGTFIVSYLKNGIFGTYRRCPVRIERDQGGIWRLINIHTGAVVNEILVKSWVLGITDLQGLCE